MERIQVSLNCLSPFFHFENFSIIGYSNRMKSCIFKLAPKQRIERSFFACALFVPNSIRYQWRSFQIEATRFWRM